jgi:iron(III) transport system permease protein
MARPVVVPALVVGPGAAASLVGAATLVLLLGVAIAWPVAALTLRGLALSPLSWPWRVALDTLAVALAATLGALVPATVIAWALLRAHIPGRATAWQIFRIGAVVPPFAVALALLVLVAPPRGLAVVALAQALALLPLAVALLVRVLARVPIELEQAAEGLGAGRATVLRRITLGIARPGIRRAGFVVLGLCLADVATPLLLGGEARLLATEIVATAAVDVPAAAGGALLLVALAGLAAAAGVARSGDGGPVSLPVALPRLASPSPPALRWGLGLAVWLVAAALGGLWAGVPLGSVVAPAGGGVSLEHWAVLATPTAARALGRSVQLAVAVCALATALGLGCAWLVERRRTAVRRAVEILLRVPVVVPGVAAGLGYALAFDPAPGGATFLCLVAIVACWTLPSATWAARAALARADRSAVDAARALGAGGPTVLTRIVVPTLRPVGGWIVGHGLAAGALAVGAVIVLAGPARDFGTLTTLTLAVAGAPGAACAVATALLALAGGARWLGRAIGGPHHAPTFLA